MQKTKNK